MKVYTALDRPEKVKLVCKEKTRTRQSEKKDCDINVIMARFEKTGVLPVDSRPMFFADVSEVGDYRTALDRVRQADEFFMSLPAAVRSRFANDAAEFLDFVSDPSNADELVKMGLIEAESAPAEERVSEAAPSVSEAESGS